MNQPLGSGADFFALEAGECLDRLEQLVTRPDGPPPDDMLRTARALRGSALMANHPAIARAAAGLEAVARGIRDGARPWDAAAREQAAQAVDDFRGLVRSARAWTSDDAGRAARLTAALEALAGGSAGPAPTAPLEPTELNTGVRAFVARESALIASALDRAAQALRETPDAREPLYAVLRRMQSLRGLAELSDLTPLPEVLDGVELAVGDLTRLFAPPPEVDRLLEAAAGALTGIARDVAGAGRPDADPPEARRFTEHLLRAFAVERDVVPIESLYADGDETPMRRPESQPQFHPPAPPGPVELVSYGEHLAQAADRIVQAESATIRDLRLYALVGTLRSIGGGGDAVATALGVLARSAREAIASGAAAREHDVFGEVLRDAGALLRSLADGGDQNAVGRRLLDLANRVDLLNGEPGREGAAPAEEDADVVPIESLEYTGAPAAARADDDAVPIESLAPEAVAMGGESDRTGDRLAAAYAVLARLTREHGAGPEAVAEERAAEGEAPAPSPPPPAEGIEPEVDIRSLCYRGRGALERAGQVRDALVTELGAGGGFGTIEPLVRELIDLVPLALDAAD